MMSKINNDPLYIIRVVLGIAFIVHGISKLMDIAGAAEGLVMSVTFVIIISILELVAGLSVLFNKYAKYGSAIIVAIMIGAIVTVKYKMGYLLGYELDIAYIAMALAVFKATKCDCGVCPSCKAKMSSGKEKEESEE